MRASTHLVFIALAAVSLTGACSQAESYRQETDNTADATVAQPRFASGTGPVVAIDGAHGNLHRVDGSYAPFATLLRNDGMQVVGSDGPVSDASLDGIDLLVIANAASDSGSAFADDEVTAIGRYVESGGALLLIGDHPPYAAGARQLAAAFGVEWLDAGASDDGSGVFSLANGGLVDDPVLNGVTQVRTFTGSCFFAENARPLLRTDDRWSLQTVTATGLSPKKPAAGCLQGALLEIGEGRVGVFSEAGMFTAQVFYRGNKQTQMGFQAKGAEQHKAFILNVVHWLARADSQGTTR